MGIFRPRQLPDPEICSLSELDLAMRSGPDHKANRRLNAIHLLLVGVSFEHVVRRSCRTERCVRLWVARYNPMGIDGLIYRPRSGGPRLLDGDGVRNEILPVLEDPAAAGQLHWTAKKLTGWLRSEHGLEISYRTVARNLHEHDYARSIPRPVPEPPDRDAWLKQRGECVQPLKCLLDDPSAVVLFGDEAGFEGDPRPRHQWVKRGRRSTQGYYGGHVRLNVVGAVEPCCRPPGQPDRRSLQHLKGGAMAGYLTNNGEALTQKLLVSLHTVLTDSKLVRSVCTLPSLNRK